MQTRLDFARPSIHKLMEMLDSKGGWATSETFAKWAAKQRWRQCLPEVFLFLVAQGVFVELGNPNYLHCPVACKYKAESPQRCLADRVGRLMSVELKVFLTIHPPPKERVTEHSRMESVKLGLLLPHEIFSALYHYESGVLFHSLMTGTPSETQQHAKQIEPQQTAFATSVPVHGGIVYVLAEQQRSCRHSLSAVG